jgi:hypothetical protein
VEESGEECGGWLGGREGERRRNQAGRWGSGRGHIREHGSVEEREMESSHAAGLRTAGGAGVPFGWVAVAQDRRPDVAGRREDSGGGAGGGRGSKATRGRGEGGASLQRLGKRPAAVDHARGRNRGDRGLEEEDEGRFAKTQKCRDPSVMLW